MPRPDLDHRLRPLREGHLRHHRAASRKAERSPARVCSGLQVRPPHAGKDHQELGVSLPGRKKPRFLPKKLPQREDSSSRLPDEAAAGRSPSISGIDRRQKEFRKRKLEQRGSRSSRHWSRSLSERCQGQPDSRQELLVVPHPVDQYQASHQHSHQVSV